MGREEGPGGDVVVVETKGRCCFCSKSVSPSSPVKLLRPDCKNGSLRLQSLQCLSKYLTLNIVRAKQQQLGVEQEQGQNDAVGKVSSTGQQHHSLDQVRESSKLKVELCEDCAQLNRKFSEVYQQLEKLSMEVTFWLKLILVKLEKAWAEDIAADFQPLTSPQYRTPEEVRLLREKVVEKSSMKLMSFRAPQVYIENMTMGEMDEEKEKIKRDFPAVTSHLKEVMMNPPSPLDYHSALELEGEHWNSSNGNANDDHELWEHTPDTEATDHDGEMKSETSARVKRIKDEMKGASAKTPACKRVIIKTWNWKCTTMDPKTGTTKCNDCSREFPSRRAFQDHYRKAHLQLQYQCPFCNKMFKNQYTYSYHRKSVHLGRKYKCMKCRNIFPNKSSYQEHRQQTSCGVRDAREVAVKHACNVCGKSFSTPKSLRLHVKGFHLKILDHPCPKCGKGFPAARNLQNHLPKCPGATATTTVTRKSAPPIKKEVTESMLTAGEDDGNSNVEEEPVAIEGIDRHEVDGQSQAPAVKMEGNPLENSESIRIVTLERGIFPPKLQMRDKYTIDIDRGKFSCKLCPAEYPTQEGIHKHYKRDHLKLRYKCSDCDKIFVSREHYIKHHDSAHIGIKFKCEKCSKLFKWERSLADHLQKSKCREEGTPKPVGKHVCLECGNRFWRSGALDAHMKQVHLKVRDHVCRLCGRGCATKYSLAAHLEVAHSDRWEHECDKCGKRYKTKSSLESHCRVKHS